MVELQNRRNYYTLRFAVSIKEWNAFEKVMDKENELRLLLREYDSKDDYFVVDIGVPLYDDKYSKRAKKILDKFDFSGKAQKL